MPDANNKDTGVFGTFSLFASLFIFALGCAVLTGWVLGIELLKSVLAGAPSMKVNTALSFILTGTSLFLTGTLSGSQFRWAAFIRSERARRMIALACAAIVTLLAALTLSEYATGAGLGIDQLLVRDTGKSGVPGRMAPNTAFDFLLIGLALFALSNSEWLRRHTLGFTLAGMLIAAPGVLSAYGYLAGIEFALGWGSYTRMAAHTATGLVVAGAGIVALAWHKANLVWSLGRRITAGLLFGVLLVIAVTVVSYKNTVLLVEAEYWRDHALRVVSAISRVRYVMAELESSTRGYVITGEGPFLETYRDASARTDARISEMETLVADNPIQFVRAGEIRKVVALRLAFAERIVGSRRDQGAAPATALLATGEGERLSAEIRSLAMTMEQEELTRLDSRTARARAINQRTFVILPAGAFISLLVFTSAAFLINKEINNRKSKERLLEAEKEFSESAINSMPGIFCVVSDAGELLRWNTSFPQVLLCTEAEVTRRKFQDCFAAEDRVFIDSRIQQALEDGRAEIQARVLRGSGKPAPWFFALSRFVIDDHLCVIGVGVDVSERERAFDLLFESEVRFRATFDQAAVGIAHVAPEGRFIRVNQKLCDIVGYTRAELLAKTFQEITWHEDLETDVGLANQVLRGEIKTYTLEKRYMRKDGLLVWINLTVSLVRDSSGEPDYFIAVIEDIGRRKAAETELQKLNEELERRVAARTAQLETANRDLEAFSYSVSHDLRAPLRAVDGFSRVLVEEYSSSLPEKAVRYLNLVRTGAQQMGTLIGDLLNFARLGRKALVREEVSPLILVSRSLETLHAEQTGRDIKLTVGELKPCTGDAALLEHVWQNLLSNALKYTRTRETAVIEAGSFERDGSTVYFVRDNGVGFDPKYAAKIFGAFQRLHLAEDFEGSGIGLALVQRIVHLHGGSIWAESEPGRGATFFFTLGGTDSNE